MTGLGSLQRQYLILILHCTNKCSVLSGSVGVSKTDDVKLSPWYNALMAVVVSISSIFFFAAALLLTIPFSIAYTFGMGVSEADDVELSPCQQSARNVLTSICSTYFFGAALVLVVPVIVVYTDMTIFTLVCRHLCNSVLLTLLRMQPLVAAIVVAAIVVEAIVTAAIMADYAVGWCLTAIYAMDTSDCAITIMAAYPMSWCLTAIYAMVTNLELSDFACIPTIAYFRLILLVTILWTIMSRTTGNLNHLIGSFTFTRSHQYLLPHTHIDSLRDRQTADSVQYYFYLFML